MNKIIKNRSSKNFKRVLRRLITCSILIILIITISLGYLLTNRTQAKYSNNIDVNFVFRNNTPENPTTYNFDESEIKYTKNIIDSLVHYLNSSKYEINFSDEFLKEKRDNLKIVYADFENKSILGRFDPETGYILISSKLKQANEQEKFLTISHEVIHYLTYIEGKDSGLVKTLKIQDTTIYTGCGINEGITQKIRNDYAEYIKPGIIKEKYPNNSYAYNSLVKIVDGLELSLGKDLYKYYFTNDIKTLSKQFNYKVHKKTYSYILVDPYEYLIHGMDNVLNELNSNSTIDEKKIQDINFALFEILTFAIESKIV